jgi:glyoxylase-like metal-dependent hydrolase (beta-lactamase superfamily II)
MKQVMPGVYRMNLPLSGFNPDSVNIYLIETPAGFTCIDTGWDSEPAFQSMEEQIAEIGATISDIKEVILTHCHIDHMGMIIRFKKSFPVKLYLHEKERDLIKIRFTGGDNFLPMTDKYLQTHGFPAAELTPPEFQLPIPPDLSSVKADVILYGGESIQAGRYTLSVINTPGHTPGHIALYEPAGKFLFSGDMLLPTIATNAAFHVQLIANPLQLYLESLQTLRKLDIQTVMPGHEDVFSGARQRIDELTRDHAEKSAQVLAAFTDKEAKTAYAVSRMLAVSPRTRKNVWGAFTGWDKRFAVLQTIAHLEFLRSKQILTIETLNGITYYRRSNKG